MEVPDRRRGAPAGQLRVLEAPSPRLPPDRGDGCGVFGPHRLQERLALSGRRLGSHFHLREGERNPHRRGLRLQLPPPRRTVRAENFEKGTLTDASGAIPADKAALAEAVLDQSTAKLFSESTFGTAALVSDNASYMAGTGLASAKAAARNGSAAFAAIQGGSSRYVTGSHVSMNAGTVTAGYAADLQFGSNTATIAPYFEAGWGTSTSKANDQKGDGRHNFYGLGIAAGWEHESGLHAEAILRGGFAETKFNAVFAEDSADYKAESAYFGAAVGAGYVWNVTESDAFDPYVRYSWTRIGSDTADLNNRDADKYDIDSVNVQTLRAGLNLSAQMSVSVKARVGAAYEHVFDGDADGLISGLVIDNSASLEGNRGVFELGLTIAPTESSLSLDLGLSGYAGDREGVSGNVQVNYKF